MTITKHIMMRRRSPLEVTSFKDFAFNIRLRNPNSSSKKVIVRIFLGHQKPTNVNGIADLKA